MHYVILNQHLEGFEEILEIGQSPVLGEIPVLLDEGLQCSPIAVLIYKIDIVGSFKNLDKLDNMSGVFDLGEGLDFVNGKLFQSWTDLVFLDFDDFDGDGLLRLLVNGLVDFPELALPDHCLQAVVFDLFSHHQLLIYK